MMGTISAIEPTLDENPAVNYQPWSLAIQDFASNLCTEQFPDAGLLGTGVAHTEVAWAMLHPATLDAAGVLVPYPKVMPVQPVMHAANAHAAVINQYNTDRSNYVAHIKGITMIKMAILGSIGRFANTLKPHAGQTVQSLLEAVANRYGVLRTSDIAELEARNAVAFTSPSTFEAQAADMGQVFTFLAHNGQPKSNNDQMLALENANKFIAPIHRLLLKYKEHTPLLADRTFPLQVAYVVARIGDITSGEAGYAGAATKKEETVAQQVIKELTPMIAHMIAAAMKGVEKPAAPHRQRRVGAERLVLRYCFVHGLCSHAGVDCTIMINDPGRFTTKMMAATAACTINGIKGSERGCL